MLFYYIFLLFKDITEAYKTLTDVTSRHQYDLHGLTDETVRKSHEDPESPFSYVPK